MNAVQTCIATVLVVDDDECTRAAFDAVLTGAGHFVICAPNGGAAVEILRTVAPDAVVSDVNMPELGGIELCRLIRSLPRLQHVSVVVVSSQASQEFPETQLVDAFLRKPVDPTQLVRAVSGLVHSRGEQQLSPARAQCADDAPHGQRL